MTDTAVKRLARVLAIQAEIEGMKIENKIREMKNEAPAYNEGHFQERAAELNQLAALHAEHF